jgi:hypothetical protein
MGGKRLVELLRIFSIHWFTNCHYQVSSLWTQERLKFDLGFNTSGMLLMKFNPLPSPTHGCVVRKVCMNWEVCDTCPRSCPWCLEPKVNIICLRVGSCKHCRSQNQHHGDTWRSVTCVWACVSGRSHPSRHQCSCLWICGSSILGN